jgi:hypothetical protein
LSSDLLHMVVLVAALAGWTGQAVIAGYAATRRGRSFNVWTVAGLIVGPVAIVLALLLPQRRLYG